LTVSATTVWWFDEVYIRLTEICANLCNCDQGVFYPQLDGTEASCHQLCVPSTPVVFYDGNLNRRDSGSSPKRSHYNFGICCNNSAPYMQLYHQINTTGCPSVYNVQKEHTIGVPLSPTQMPLCPTGMPLSPTGLSGHAAPSGGLHHYATPVMHCCRAATGRQPLRGTMSRRSRLLGCP